MFFVGLNLSPFDTLILETQHFSFIKCHKVNMSNKYDNPIIVPHLALM